jgi:hypothetical protein
VLIDHQQHKAAGDQAHADDEGVEQVALDHLGEQPADDRGRNEGEQDGPTKRRLRGSENMPSAISSSLLK